MISLLPPPDLSWILSPGVFWPSSLHSAWIGGLRWRSAFTVKMRTYSRLPLGLIWSLSHLPSPVELDELCSRIEEVVGGWGRALSPSCSVPITEDGAHLCPAHQSKWILTPIRTPHSQH